MSLPAVKDSTPIAAPAARVKNPIVGPKENPSDPCDGCASFWLLTAHARQDCRRTDARISERSVHCPVSGEPEAAERERQFGGFLRRQGWVDGEDRYVSAHVGS